MKLQKRYWAVVAVIACSCSSPEDSPKVLADMGADDASVPDVTDTSTEPDATVVSAEDVARSAREARCELFARCAPEWAYDFQFADHEDCVERGLRTPWWDLPDVEFDASTYDTCVEALTNATCEDWTTLPEACIVQGTRTDGESCERPEQCASAYCELDVDTYCGTCAPKSSPGDPCKERTVDDILFTFCSNGLVCGADETCKVPAALGEACERGECRDELSCVDGTCVDRAALGDSCGGPSQPGCYDSAGQICDGQSCVQVELAELGESCSEFGACRAPGTCVEGTCIGAAALGEACVTNQRCEDDGRCIGGRCTVPNCAAP